MNPDRKAYRELEVQKRKAILMLSHQIIGQFVVENLYKKIWPLKLKLKKKSSTHIPVVFTDELTNCSQEFSRYKPQEEKVINPGFFLNKPEYLPCLQQSKNEENRSAIIQVQQGKTHELETCNRPAAVQPNLVQHRWLMLTIQMISRILTFVETSQCNNQAIPAARW